MRLFLIICVLVACSLIVSTLWVGWEITLTSESGMVELAGLIVFALGAVLSLWRMPKDAWRHWWPIPTVFVLFCLRELDVHDAFFTPGLLQTKIFTSAAPLWQKGVSAAAMGGILLTLVLLVMRGTRPLVHALRNGQGWAWAIVGGVCFAVASVLVDGADRQLAAIGVTLPYAGAPIWTAVEEILELCFALSLIFAICKWGRNDAGLRAA
ncbi:hypothetical protein [Loktanella salsilacus]|uniref:hypothetical protein n=1 Tax=Loktanella salsilacus TaxID=195913 RepID=UPI003703F20D